MGGEYDFTLPVCANKLILLLLGYLIAVATYLRNIQIIIKV
jgi:hypothetical protein